ncbi:Uncharacterized protein Rs2_45722 [Raphanus sativus]|nr:Uncharacterized protein Rs2_45722 [Raphanus sativus]
MTPGDGCYHRSVAAGFLREVELSCYAAAGFSAQEEDALLDLSSPSFGSEGGVVALVVGKFGATQGGGDLCKRKSSPSMVTTTREEKRLECLRSSQCRKRSRGNSPT